MLTTLAVISIIFGLSVLSMLSAVVVVMAIGKVERWFDNHLDS